MLYGKTQPEDRSQRSPARPQRTRRRIRTVSRYGSRGAGGQQDGEKTASFVLASHRGLNVPRGYASPPCLLRPRWTDFLTILLNFELRLIQPRIHPAAFHERLMVAFFHNRPSFDDNDAVHVV